MNQPSPAPQSPLDSAADAFWDAGPLGCGELILQLRKRLLAMPGQRLQLRAVDAGAPEDIPAYCRMTGHTLEQAAPPLYWIRARTVN